MKVAHIFAHAGNGGAENYALRLALFSREKGDETFFIIGSKGPLSERLDRAKIRFYILPMKTSFNPFAVLISVMKLANLLKKENCNIIHTHMLREHFFSIFSKFFGTKVRIIRTIHRLDQFNTKMKPLLGILNSKTDAFIVFGEYMKNYLLKNGIIGKIFIVPNGVPEFPKISKHQKAIGFLGRLSSEKGIKKFIEENVTGFREEKLLVGGEGPQRKEIEKFVTDTKLNVEFLGQVDNLVGFFEQISVLVLPSETEAMPLVVLEAFAAKIPVVVFDLPTLREIVDNDQIVSVGNYIEMFERAVSLLDNKEVGERNYEHFKKLYTVEAMFLKTNNIYQELVQK